MLKAQPVYCWRAVRDDYHCTPVEGAVVDVWHSYAKGLYSGRLAHIHVRALFPGTQQWSAIVTQLFLPTDFDSFVYNEAPYQGRGIHPMTLERDPVLRGDADTLGKLTIAVDRTARPGGVGYINLRSRS